MSTAPAAGLAAANATAVAVRVPAAFFSMVMGLGGLALAWGMASRAYGVSPWLADALLAVSALLWVAIAAAQAVKAVTARDRLVAELRHPVDGSHAALGPASLLLLAAGISVHYRDVAHVLFWIGAAAQLAYAVWIAGRWLTAPMDPKLVTPAMYLPPVAGNLLAAAAAGAVGQSEAGWLFFGAGVLAWLVLAAVLLVRHLSEGELPPASRPLLAFELAPPALALLAWQSLEGGGADATSAALLGFGLFVGLVLLRLAGRFRTVAFAPSYWAFAFPLATLAAAVLRTASAAPRSLPASLALPLFVIANAVVAVIAYRTVSLVARGKLLPPE